MFQDAVMVPPKESTIRRTQRLAGNDFIRHASATKSNFGVCMANNKDREWVYPTNVLHQATVCNNVGHSAAFPDWLPEFFIKLFTEEQDVVLDPFAGSGTTVRVALSMNRKGVGIEVCDNII